MRAIAIAQSEICTVIYGDHAAAARARQFVSVEAERDCARKREIVRKRNILIEIIVSVRKRAAFRRQRRPTVMICMLLGGKSAFGGGGERRHPQRKRLCAQRSQNKQKHFVPCSKSSHMFLQNLYFYRKAALHGCRKFLFSANKKGRPRSTKSTACPKIRRRFKEAVYPPPSEYSLHCYCHASFSYSAANSLMQ